MEGCDIPSLFAVITNLLRSMPEGKLQGIRQNLEKWKLSIVTDYESNGLYTGNTLSEGKDEILKVLLTMTAKKMKLRQQMS